jgi:hypothetical protein
MAIEVGLPFPIFLDDNGEPIENGRLYVGMLGLEPVSNPQPAFWDSALTIPANEIVISKGRATYMNAPAVVYTALDYSMAVYNSKGKRVLQRLVPPDSVPLTKLLTESRGNYVRSARTPPSFSLNSVVESGLYSWINGASADIPANFAAGDSFILHVIRGADGAGLVHQHLIDCTLFSEASRVSLDNGTSWSAWGEADGVVRSESVSPCTILPGEHVLRITTGASNFVANLPSASAVLGEEVRVSKIDAGAGYVAVTAVGGDVIENAGVTECYISAQYDHITLVAAAAGIWRVIDGKFEPSHSLDAPGSHLKFGKLHHMPMPYAAAVPRALVNGQPVTVDTVVQATGNFGIPVGAKGLRIKVILDPYLTAAGSYRYEVAFKTSTYDNWGMDMAIPEAGGSGYGAIGNVSKTKYELDIPLNATGQFYYIFAALTNITVASSKIYIVPMGYYMGD